MPVETLSAWQFRELNNNTWTREDGSCHSLVRIVCPCSRVQPGSSARLHVDTDYIHLFDSETGEAPFQLVVTKAK